MRTLLAILAISGMLSMTASLRAEEPIIGHMVYFKLKDQSPAAKQKLVEACKKYLTDHEGTVFFAAGVLGESFDRPVNDREWDVALHLVFKNKAAHDKYAVAERHLKFIDENKANWEKVRVFDSEIAPTK
ncbi:Dabb family protein [Tuwongella immobilis]|uniref:Stress-response A/B barrel domain-containing protein n=1 Tax=Tuwongella immobilis TaxID=692036 RepID=A0A6C2YMX5_9BACT|nr:Dabb family protein [Tuwongella immobilis]VIP02727.1 Stress responsive alpha-beta barrel domain protein OS=Pirellula staleyi (strain ATCC 27377 / DSM 6068 / ICPB 4128) GN=Psta_0649 PE=4 SV=1: Dabb [Tuwongella immobilis]VTS02272.1 Stress responsive alpha-beta barrel domain protein OS=Pirellula staleyi (strain ATCC 27377 / DSM 6068 / ICPB 4128) GN=Psta_0649 PE=4 SV=1: Dabb [Tuwongella immobilis]